MKRLWFPCQPKENSFLSIKTLFVSLLICFAYGYYYSNRGFALLFCIIYMAEIHIIGQILSAVKFPKQSLFCKWSLQFGNNWKIISGHLEGQTQVDSSQYSDTSYWYYPLDIHFGTKGVQGWPKIHIQVYHLDWVGRVHLYGYGYVMIPTTSGVHEIDCFTWRPISNFKDRVTQYFLGGTPQLKCPDLIFSSPERYKLETETMGIVKIELGIILRNFSKYGLEYKQN